MSNPKHEKQDWLDGLLEFIDKNCVGVEKGTGRHGFNYDEAKQQIISKIEEMLDSIENSVKQHTVPEGTDLVTRSYVLNTIEFERKRLKGKA